jgi:hypothetical protein
MGRDSMHRRRVLMLAGASAGLLAGCTDAGDEAETIEEELNEADEDEHGEDQNEEDGEEVSDADEEEQRISEHLPTERFFTPRLPTSRQ